MAGPNELNPPPCTCVTVITAEWLSIQCQNDRLLNITHTHILFVFIFKKNKLHYKVKCSINRLTLDFQEGIVLVGGY